MEENDGRAVVMDAVRADGGEGGEGCSCAGCTTGERSREREKREFEFERERRDLRMGEDHAGMDLSLLISDRLFHWHKKDKNFYNISVSISNFKVFNNTRSFIDIQLPSVTRA